MNFLSPFMGGKAPVSLLKELRGSTGFARKVGAVFVRCADDMKIAHRFIGGSKREPESQSVKRTADDQQNTGVQPSAADLMICLPGDPSTKVPGYFHFVRCADDNYQTFRAESVQPLGCCSCNAQAKA